VTLEKVFLNFKTRVTNNQGVRYIILTFHPQYFLLLCSEENLEGEISSEDTVEGKLSKRVREILRELEEEMGEKTGRISTHKKTTSDIKKEISKDENKKAITKITKGNSLEDLAYKQLEKGKMELFSTEDGFFYQQRFNRSDLGIIDSQLGTNWEICYLDHEGDNFYIFGDTCMTKLSAEKSLQPIKMIKPSNWKKIP